LHSSGEESDAFTESFEQPRHAPFMPIPQKPARAGVFDITMSEDEIGTEADITLLGGLGTDEFQIQILKDGDGAGLEIESVNGMLLVAKLKRGPMARWNASHAHEPRAMVRIGDRILKVNGVEGDGNLLIDELKKDKHLTLVLRHAQLFKVEVEKGSRELGMCVVGGNVKLDMLKISALRDGVIQQWKSESGWEVQVGDRITTVNGVSGDPQAMLEELQAKSSLQMTMIRPH